MDENFPNPQIVEQLAAIIDHIEHVESFGIAPVCAHIGQHFVDCPMRFHRDEIRRHQTAHAVLRITEQYARDLTFLRGEKLNQLPRRRARQLLQQCRAIVRRHLVQNPDHLFMRHPTEEMLLRIDIEIFKNIRRQIMRQHAEDDHLIVLLHIENHLRHVRRRPFRKQFAQAHEIARIDQALDFRDENFADHTRAWDAAGLYHPGAMSAMEHPCNRRGLCRPGQRPDAQ